MRTSRNKSQSSRNVGSSSTPSKSGGLEVKSVKTSSSNNKYTEVDELEIEKITSKKEVNYLEEENTVESQPIVEKVGKSEITEIRKLTASRVFLMILVGLISSAFLGLSTCGLYYRFIRYPSERVESYEGSGLEALDVWTYSIKLLDKGVVEDILGKSSYLIKELDYANGVKYKEDFIKKVISTVSYVPVDIEATNVYGNTLVNENDEVVYKSSLVNGDNEEVVLHYIDYANVKLDSKKIRNMMKEKGLTVGDVDYSNKLVEIFCNYITSLEDEKIPLVSVKHTPSLTKVDGGFSISSEEDIFLDKALFSSKDFYWLLQEFSLIASGGNDISHEWEEWNSLSEEEKKDKKEPVKVHDLLQPRKEWSEWNSKPYSERVGVEEPTKYDYKKIISMSWCGAYYLTNEYSYTDDKGNVVNKEISAGVGDGTLENPAGLNTDIVTSIFVLEENEDGAMVRVAKPIRIRLIDFGVSQKAIDYFETKDERNRGFDIKSEIQYAYYTFEVTNLSGSRLTIYDDSSLADELANMSPRTGTIYGLQGSVSLEPDEVGIIETWGSSTELNTKYVVWGSDFNREEPVVWFRVLAGDVDDPSEDKGVSLNKTKQE